MKNAFRFVLIIFFLAASYIPIFSQWTPTNVPCSEIYCLTTCPKNFGGINIIAGTHNGVFVSSNNGSSWDLISTDPPIENIFALAACSDSSGRTNIFAATWIKGIFISTNNGTDWTSLGLENIGIHASITTHDNSGGTNIFWGTDAGIFRTTNEGSNLASIGFTYPVYSLASAQKKSGKKSLYAGCNVGGVLMSSDNGNYWTNIGNDGIKKSAIYAIATYTNEMDTTYIFAASYGEGVYISTDNGINWTLRNQGMDNSYSYITSLAMVDTVLIAGTNGGIFRSFDYGTSWHVSNSGLICTWVNAIQSFPNGNGGSNILVGTAGGGAYLSTDDGTSWTVRNKGISGGRILSSAISGNNIFVGTYRAGVFLSTDEGDSWNGVNNGFLINPDVTSLIFFNNKLYAGTDDGIYISTDNGATWTLNIDTTTELRYTNAFAILDTILFAGTDNRGISLTTNNGLTWTGVLPYEQTEALIVIDSVIVAGTFVDGIFTSSDHGQHWIESNNGLTNNNIMVLAASPNKNESTNIFAGTFQDGIFRSRDYGKSWTAVNSGLTGNGLAIRSFAVYDTMIFAGTNSGIFFSTNEGDSWTAIETSLPFLGVQVLLRKNSNLFAGTYNGLFRSPLSKINTSVNFKPDKFPFEYSLNQNYPNPFNPLTTISFNVPSKSYVSLKIFDVLGREVSIIMSEELPPGKYSRKWNASSFPSGIYFYRLQAGSKSETKKLVLLK